MLNEKCPALQREKEIDLYTCHGYGLDTNSSFAIGQPISWFPTGCVNGKNTEDCMLYKKWREIHEPINSKRRKI